MMTSNSLNQPASIAQQLAELKAKKAAEAAAPAKCTAKDIILTFTNAAGETCKEKDATTLVMSKPNGNSLALRASNHGWRRWTTVAPSGYPSYSYESTKSAASDYAENWK